MEAEPDKAAAIGERLKRLDEAVAELKKKRKDAWEIVCRWLQTAGAGLR